jgi:hypothetical protein
MLKDKKIKNMFDFSIFLTNRNDQQHIPYDGSKSSLIIKVIDFYHQLS